MRTTLDIDDEILAAAMEQARGRTKTRIVNEALREWTKLERRKDLLQWQGKVEWEGDLDEMRGRT